MHLPVTNVVGWFFVIMGKVDEYYFDQAMVLDREDSNEIDNRFHIYAKGFGKIVARGKSTRKITSKLSGHLEPGNIVKARFIEKNGLQVVDALKVSSIKYQVSDLYFLNKLLPEGDFDFQIWCELLGNLSTGSGREFSWQRMLKILGWDSEHGVCSVCGDEGVCSFSLRGQEFFCERCESEEGSGRFLSSDDCIRLDRRI